MTTLYDLIRESTRRPPPPDYESGWIQVYPSGKKVYPLDLHPDDIDIKDIATALGNQCRFAGHVRHHYSVAQHSVVVADHLPPPLRFAGLLHDSPETYLVDVPRPVKHLPAFEAYRDAERRVWKVISKKYGLPIDLPPEVHAMDDRALVTEAHQLKAPLHADWRVVDAEGKDVEPLLFSLPRITPEVAAFEFLERFHRYRPEPGH